MPKEYREGKCTCGTSREHKEIENFDSCIRGRIDVTVCNECKVITKYSIIR